VNSSPPTSSDASEPSLPVRFLKPTRQRYIVMGFLCVLSFLTYFDRVCIVRAQGDIQKDLGIDDNQMALIFGAFWLAYALFEIPGGWMGDRYGARVTLTRIVLAWSLFTVLSGSATGLLSLLLFRFLFGMGEAGAYPNMARVQANWLPAKSRARFGGLLWLVARFGGAFSPLLFGAMLRCFDDADWRALLTSLHLPGDVPAWRMGFWAAGLIGVVWCLGFFFWFRDDPADVPSVNAAELQLIKSEAPSRPGGHHMPWPVWKALLTSRSLWAIGCLYIFYSFGWSFFITWLPRYLKDEHHLEFDKSELISGLPLFFGGISCLVGGALSDYAVRRLGRKWLGRAIFPALGYSIAALSMACVPFAQTPEHVTALVCLAAAGGDFGQGANWATIVDVGGRYAGTATGFINMVGNAGNYLQPSIGAIIFRQLGWNVLMGVYAVAFLGAACMWLLVNPDRTFYLEKEPTPKDLPGAARSLPLSVDRGGGTMKQEGDATHPGESKP
jgi:ACS family glucarate transporter-like MFS transporter